MPFLSILLPTRDRLEYLRQAVETVLRQDDGDWELVVSDNRSDDDVAGFVRSLSDDRIRYVATERLLPVTDNWNLALAHSRGEYVVMLGDDDALMPGFVSTIRSIIDDHAAPELIYSSAWLFAHPNVFPDEPGGYIQPYGYASFLRGRRTRFELDPAVARKAVERAMRLKATYGYNMQFSTVSRKLIDRLAPRGPFFQSRFPDYYASNAAFLNADRIVVEPRPLVAIGVTPKSYGFFHANSDERGGKSFLEGHADEDARREAEAAEMPGTNINTGWLSAVQTLRSRFPDLLDVPVAIRRFRFLQALFVYEGHYLRGDTSVAQVELMERYLHPRARRVGRLTGSLARAAQRRLPGRAWVAVHSAFHLALARQHPYWAPAKIRGRYRNLVELFESPPPDPPPPARVVIQRLRKTAV